MLFLAKAVTRASPPRGPRALVVGDMPFGSYLDVTEGVRNACRFVKEARCDAVKLEGFRPELVEAIVRSGIPVVAHLGLSPQTAAMSSGFRYCGQTCKGALQLVEQARAMEVAGASCLVLELVPEEVAKAVTLALEIPTIGIGAGRFVSGQVLVSHDLLGLLGGAPKFSKQYCDLGGEMRKAFAAYREEVVGGAFPAEEHVRGMNSAELKKFREQCLSSPVRREEDECEDNQHDEKVRGRDVEASMLSEVRAASNAPTVGCSSAPDGGSSPVFVSGVVGSKSAAVGDKNSFRAQMKIRNMSSSCATQPVQQPILAADQHRTTPAQSPLVCSSRKHEEYRLLNEDHLGSLRSLPGPRPGDVGGVAPEMIPKRTRGFVPTMGSLHEGHLELVKTALRDCEQTVVSIFVNPSQFAAHEDFHQYPRTIKSDVEKLEGLLQQESSGRGGEKVIVVKTETELDALLSETPSTRKLVVWCPSVEEMYPSNSKNVVPSEGTEMRGAPNTDPGVEQQTEDHDVVLAPGGSFSAIGVHAGEFVKGVPEDMSRPHFFRGVATVVEKLFKKAKPCVAYFGQKDHIQCVLVRRLVEIMAQQDHLAKKLQVVVCPTCRETDGLAMSSRNVYLSPQERGKSRHLSRALVAGRRSIEDMVRKLRASGEEEGWCQVAERGREVVRAALLDFDESGAGDFEIEYVTVCWMRTGRELDAVEFPLPSKGQRQIVLAVAVRVGKNVRLIDNVVV